MTYPDPNKYPGPLLEKTYTWKDGNVINRKNEDGDAPYQYGTDLVPASLTIDFVTSVYPFPELPSFFGKGNKNLVTVSDVVSKGRKYTYQKDSKGNITQIDADATKSVNFSYDCK